MQGMTWIVLFIVFGGLSLLSTKIKPTQRKLLIRITYIVLLLFSIIYSPSSLADIYRYKEELLYMKSYGAAASALHLRYIYDYSTGFLVFMRIMSLMPTWMFIPVTMITCSGPKQRNDTRLPLPSIFTSSPSFVNALVLIRK